MADIIVKNVDNTQKLKASFILKSKGKNLSDAVRDMINKYAREYDQKK